MPKQIKPNYCHIIDAQSYIVIGMRLVLLFVVLFCFSSCNSTKFLKEDETFLKKNIIEVNTPDDNGKKVLIAKLKTLTHQKPNGKLLGVFPKEWIYYKNSEPGDTSKINKFMREKVGEPPAIYDHWMTQKSAQDMQNYLSNRKGYFNAKVEYDSLTLQKITAAIYKVNTGQRYRVNSVTYISKDEELLNFVNQLKKDAILKKGDYIDASTADLELTRLTYELQNNGYANFASNYFTIKGDSSLNKNAVDLYIEIRTPVNQGYHQKYYIGDVKVYTDYFPNVNDTTYSVKTIGNKKYFSHHPEFLVNPKVINRKIYLSSGNTYRRIDYSATQKKLSELGAYKFVTINVQPKPGVDSLLEVRILLTPFKTLWETDTGGDFFFSTISQNNRRIFGISLNEQLKNRNILGGSENFTISAEAGAEIQIQQPQVILRTFNTGINTALEIPKFVDAYGLKNIISKATTQKQYNDLQNNTTSTINAGFHFVNVFDSYRLSSVNIGLRYIFKPNPNTRWVFRQTTFEYNDYNLKEAFKKRIEANKLLLRSYDDNLITGLIFHNLNFVNNKYLKRSGLGRTIFASLEISGLETFLLNNAYNAITGKNDTWKLTGDIVFSKYVKTKLETRITKTINTRQSIAFRGFAGVIIPFGEVEASPFFKQFSVGGANSMRGWNQKELGPGSYSELLVHPIEGQTFYQTGDIRFEANVEYRFDMIWYLEGAIFLDAGNVWTLKENASRPGAKISSHFLNEIAINTGYGVRLDFDYFNIRFDFGLKLRNPFPREETGRYWLTWREFKKQKLGTFHVAINYPF